MTGLRDRGIVAFDAAGEWWAIDPADGEVPSRGYGTPSLMDARKDIRAPEDRSDKANKGGCCNLREQVPQPGHGPVPRTATGIKDRVNAKIKFREGFRPFAPVVPEERVADYFEELSADLGFMGFVGDVRPEYREQFAGIAHVDGTARTQAVREERAPQLAAILDAFKAKSGYPVLLNTSFNRKGEPIVETLTQAADVYLGTGMDALVTDSSVSVKKA